MSERIRGRVLDAEDRSPIADASVIIVEGPAPVPDIAALTDQSGSFALSVPTRGSWRLCIFDQSGSEHEVVVQVPQSSELEVSIEIDMSVPEEDGDDLVSRDLVPPEVGHERLGSTAARASSRLKKLKGNSRPRTRDSM